MEKRALILVDIQRDFLPGGALAVPDADAILPLVRLLIERNEMVVATQDWPLITRRAINRGILSIYMVSSKCYGQFIAYKTPRVLNSPTLFGISMNVSAKFFAKGRMLALIVTRAFSTTADVKPQEWVSG